ncbi:hypothetical protein [Budvicia aquatica]|uniref:hypothetical protein n=1 Tax=Budvicia aquatica TaxID=82979 RepID=UPI0020862EC1|nr:hypothetical protein [Budvicia aquatica]GKX52716.1 hypothetical protein SOASR029_30250 [Budvicia aquatica]
MKARAKFARVKNRRGNFAEIEIEVYQSDKHCIKWDPCVSEYKSEYGVFVAKGINKALDIHIELGGSISSFRVTDFVELVCDINEYIVECVAMSAAWQALGHNEGDIVYEYTDYWTARIDVKD